mmetsp:Transcript_116695/g.325187  ORF Transcript_116695/g.325187 Transcript_116695/m.325187 type:complete len:331 (-) Transcript_116695:499-1491(-)
MLLLPHLGRERRQRLCIADSPRRLRAGAADGATPAALHRRTARPLPDVALRVAAGRGALPVWPPCPCTAAGGVRPRSARPGHRQAHAHAAACGHPCRGVLWLLAGVVRATLVCQLDASGSRSAGQWRTGRQAGLELLGDGRAVVTQPALHEPPQVHEVLHGCCVGTAQGQHEAQKFVEADHPSGPEKPASAATTVRQRGMCSKVCKASRIHTHLLEDGGNLGLLQQCIELAWRKRHRGGAQDTVASPLQRQQQPRAHELGTQLFPLCNGHCAHSMYEQPEQQLRRDQRGQKREEQKEECQQATLQSDSVDQVCQVRDHAPEDKGGHGIGH